LSVRIGALRDDAIRILAILGSVVLVAHGLIHLMGTAVYMKLAKIGGFPYKTTVLDGRWDLGAGGIAVYGVLWALAAIGFSLVVLGLILGWGRWKPVLVGVIIFSLVLTAMDWSIAYGGFITNVTILAGLLLGPRIVRRFSR
jgi:hypothetical protein